MALIVADRVQETTNTTGTDSYLLGGAVAGFQAFSDSASDADTVYYAVTNDVDWEVGLGTYASATDTIARTVILSSSNSNSAVDWGVSTKKIFLTYPADKAVYVDGSGLVPVQVGVDLNTTSGTKPSYKEGVLFYDESNGALGFYNEESDITLQIGQEEYIRVYNDSGATITNGTPVYLAGTSSGIPTIEEAVADGTMGQSHAVGLATHSIENGTVGYVTVRGLVSDLDTSALTAGQLAHVGIGGGLQTASPTFPNFPTEIGICLVSNASTGSLYVDIVNESLQTLRVAGNSHFGNNLTVAGDLTVEGTQFITNTSSVSVAGPFSYLNASQNLVETFTGSGLDDASLSGQFEGTTSTTYYVRIDGTGAPDTFEWSKDNFSTTEATDVAITGDLQELDEGISVIFNATSGHTLNDKWEAAATPINIDSGMFTNRNTGASGVGYTHMGVFYDVSTGKWTFLDQYEPEPNGIIDLSDPSVVYGTLKGLTWEGSVNGNATTASTLATGRTISLTGDVTGTSGSFDGSGNVSITATIAANSVAMGTDTTGNYVASGAVSGVGLSGSAGSEGATFTVTSNATSSAGNNTIVSRDGSGNFAAGTITADLTGDVSGNAGTATALATGRTISLTGDVTGTSGSFDGSGNVSISATIAANSVALGTDTTGNYVASIANGNYLTGGGGASEGTALTLAVDATPSNTAAKVVARDGSGNFNAGTITAALSGNASSATQLQTARTIGGVSFNGTSNINLPGVNTAGNQNTSGNAGTVTNGVYTIGNQSIGGTKTFSSTISGSVSGNAVTATRLQTARTINGVSFNGTSNITVADSTKMPTSGGTFTGNITLGNNNISDVQSITVDDRITSTADTDTYLQFHTSNQWRVVVGNTERLEVNTTGVNVTGAIVASGDVTAFSDERLKSDIKTIGNAVDTVKKLRGVTFEKDGKPSMDVIAQEVQKVLPELVQENEEYLSVAYGNMVGVLIEAIKEQQQQIDVLKSKLGG